MAQTVASNPANVRVNLPHFLKSDGKDLIVLVGSVVLGGVLLAVNWKLALIVAGIGVFVALFSMSQAKDLFASGDVCPAVVLDSQRQLIAVMTDLGQGRSSRPALKVQKAPLRRAVAGETRKGTKLAYVALYSGQPGERAWTNFGGYLVDCGTTSQKTVKRVVSSISDAEWQRLLAACRDLEKPYRAGFYDLKGGAEKGASRLVARPHPLRVRPAFLIAGGVIAAPIVLMVLLALGQRLFRGGGAAPLPVAPAAAPALPRAGDAVADADPPVELLPPVPGLENIGRPPGGDNPADMDPARGQPMANNADPGGQPRPRAFQPLGRRNEGAAAGVANAAAAPILLEGPSVEGWGTYIDPDGDCQYETGAAGELTLNVPPGVHDLSLRDKTDNSPRVLQRVSGDFTIEVEVRGALQPGEHTGSSKLTPANGAGLLIWVDQDTHLRLERNSFPAGPGARRNLLSHQPFLIYNTGRRLYRRNGPIRPASEQQDSTSLRLQRSGSQVNAEMKIGAGEWESVGYFPFDEPDEVYVGVSASNTSDAPLTATFRNLQVTPAP